MLQSTTSRAVLDKFEQRLAGPLVTEEQLQRLLSVQALTDTDQRVQRLNELYFDLLRQAQEAETRWQYLEALLKKLNLNLSTEHQRLLDEAHSDLIARIRHEAQMLLNSFPQSTTVIVPRRSRLTI